MGTLTLRQVEGQEKGGIFILNRTQGIEKGRIVFQVPKANGIGSDAVVILKTFIPVDLTEQVSRKQLLESSEFRKAVNSRRLELIDQDEYDRLMKEEGAQDELNRLYNDAQAYMNTVQSLDNIIDRENNVVDPAITAHQQKQSRTTESANVGVTEDGEHVNPALLQVVASLEDDKDETAAISTLRGLGELTEAEYKYVMKNSPKEFTQIRTYCSRSIQRITGKVS